MDHEPADPLSERVIERDIESLLSVDPSPEFLARVRTRIANEPEPSRWRLAWVVVPVTGMCIVLLATGMVMWLRPQPPAPVQAVRPSSVPPTIVEREPSIEPPRRVAPVAAPTQRQPSDVARSPEVVISENERRAFEQLLLAIEQDRLPLLVRTGDDAEESLAPAPLEIEPLTIEPLEVTRLE
jgi:hypothetical protein